MKRHIVKLRECVLYKLVKLRVFSVNVTLYMCIIIVMCLFPTLVTCVVYVIVCVAACPTWTVYDDHQEKCTCPQANYHDIDGAVYCSINEHNVSLVGVHKGFCLTFNKANTSLLVGACPFNLAKHHHYTLPIKSYQILPHDPNDIDGILCGVTDRTGQLCGQCVDGYSPPVYSYYPQCVRCGNGTNNWPKYLAVSLLPTTAFFLTLTAFRFRATMSIFDAYVVFCQILTSPPIMRRIAEDMHHNQYENTVLGYGGAIYFSLFGIWNLDFFKLLYTPFCLHPNATTLQVLSLDYIIAVYPLLLIILTYTLVRLHYNNCRLVVWMWRPFIGCFARCRRQWDIQNSLVDAFATFFLLSYVKFFSVSIDILTPAYMWDVYEVQQHPVLYYDGTVEYFGREHIPFAILAVCILVLFTFLPILVLCIYPCRCFQRRLDRCHMNSLAFHWLMDTFQGYYKDGTNGTRDCRCFAAIFLILRILVNISMVISLVTFSNVISVGIILIYVFLFSTFQPYKQALYAKLDIFFLILLTVVISAAWTFHSYSAGLMSYIDRCVLLLICPIPLLYSMFLVFYHIHSKSERLQSVVNKIRLCFKRHKWSEYTLLSQRQLGTIP